jgi:hypothetical protein
MCPASLSRTTSLVSTTPCRGVRRVVAHLIDGEVALGEADQLEPPLEGNRPSLLRLWEVVRAEDELQGVGRGGKVLRWGPLRPLGPVSSALPPTTLASGRGRHPLVQ